MNRRTFLLGLMALALAPKLVRLSNDVPIEDFRPQFDWSEFELVDLTEDPRLAVYKGVEFWY